jgi:hypothetical protein
MEALLPIARFSRLTGLTVSRTRRTASCWRPTWRRSPAGAPVSGKSARPELDVRDVGEEHVLLIRGRVREDEMSTVVPERIAEVHAYLEELGVGFSGPPFCVSSAPDDERILTTEIGWPGGPRSERLRDADRLADRARGRAEPLARG